MVTPLFKDFLADEQCLAFLNIQYAPVITGERDDVADLQGNRSLAKQLLPTGTAKRTVKVDLLGAFLARAIH
jgi:hypothetical protein